MKRFTDTEKWRDPWYRQLPPNAKLLFHFLYDTCDPAGVIEIDWPLVEFSTGIAITEKEFREHFEGRFEEVGKKKFLLTKFIPFQYGTLSRYCMGHNPVFAALAKHGIVVRKEWLRETDNGQPVAEGSAEMGEAGNGTLEAFNKFWAAYPKKRNQHEAQREFIRIQGKDKIDDILKALEWQRQSEDWLKNGGQYVPSPERYLSRGAWTDSPKPVSNGTMSLSDLKAKQMALEKVINKHPANKESVYHVERPTDAQKKELKEFKAKLDDITLKIACA